MSSKNKLEVAEGAEHVRLDPWFMGLFGKDEPMQSLYEQVRKIALTEAPVLICGESGMGKNLLATAIHKLSGRVEGPFIKVDCRTLAQSLAIGVLRERNKAVPGGLAAEDIESWFEAADGGTLFLDEIGDLPGLMQTRLLRILEEKKVERVGEDNPVPVDIRLISGTSKSLTDLILEHRFLEDLFYRINSIYLQTSS